MKIKEMALEKLKPYAKNPRKNDRAVAAVAESIRQFGFKVPLVIDKDGVIVCGHTRYKAAKKLKMKTVPCVIADDLTPEQIKAFRLADNKTGELAEWDFPALDLELDGLGFDMSDFGFKDAGAAFFDREEKEGVKRQDGNAEYNEFLDKFEPKKTTDDCYTPDNIYEAVAEYVESEYKVTRDKFVRPFFPGGDYRKRKYPEGCVVVDNPPFSIFAEIVAFYDERGIKFFLFGPALTLCSGNGHFCAIASGANVLYENGADVNTSFATNLETARIKSAPRLYQKLTEANRANLEKQHKQLPKYSYPDYVLTTAMVNKFSKYGIDFSVEASESAFIRELDSQKSSGKSIYGGGFLLSESKAAEKAAAEKAAAEKAAAEKAAAKVWELSEREWKIVRALKSPQRTAGKKS